MKLLLWRRLGEGAIWLADLGVYATVDIYGPSKLNKGPAVFLHNPYDASSVTRCIPMPSYCGTVVPRASGGLLVALKDGIYAVEVATGALTFLAVGSSSLCDKCCSPRGACAYCRTLMACQPIGGTMESARRKVDSGAVPWASRAKLQTVLVHYMS